MSGSCIAAAEWCPARRPQNRRLRKIAGDIVGQPGAAADRSNAQNVDRRVVDHLIDQPDRLPLASLSATMMGLWVLEIRQPLGADVQVSGVLSTPTSSALTPLLGMNSSDVGLVKPAGR